MKSSLSLRTVTLHGQTVGCKLKKINSMENKQRRATNYDDRFAKIYDWISSKSYYSKPREFAIKELNLDVDQTVLNILRGTGQNFEYY